MAYTIHDEDGSEVVPPKDDRGVAEALAKAYHVMNQCYVELRNDRGERLYYWGVKCTECRETK